MNESHDRQPHGQRASVHDDEALARESAHVVEAVQVPLKGLLVIQELPRHGPLHEFQQPELTLYFSRRAKVASVWNRVIENGLPPRDISTALQAIEMVLGHSAKLKKYGRLGLRSAFWIQLYDSSVMGEKPKQPVEYHQWMVAQCALFPPRIVFEFGDLNEKQMDAVRQFFLQDDPHQEQHYQEQQRREACQIGLSFTNCKLSNVCLRLIQRLLDDVSAPELARRRRHDIHSLDLSHNPMKPEQLNIVTEILGKSHTNKLSRINLTNINWSPPVPDGTEHWLSQSLINQPSLTRLIRAAFSVTDATQRKRPTANPPVFRSISLAHNPLDTNHFAALGSSLRYGCVYDEISLVATLRFVDSDYKREECWRWIAFGLFYPRSKRFASAFRVNTIDLARIVLERDGVAAFAKTLVDPVAEFRCSGTEEGLEATRARIELERGGSWRQYWDQIVVHDWIPSTNTIIVCNIFRGATIFSRPDTASTPLMALESEQAWEALFAIGDTNWLNVVVPGHGLGWVEAHYVGEREQEPLVEVERVGLILNHFRIHNDISDRLGRIHGLHLHALLMGIGHRLHSLEIRCAFKVNLGAVFDHCSGLKHLDLQRNALDFGRDGALVSFLRGPSGCQLRSLNLNGTALDDRAAEELGELMRDAQCLSRLRELRLFLYSQNVLGLEILSDALSANKTIGLVELCAVRPEVQAHFNAIHKNEQVEMTTLPLAHRLAFVSVFTNETSTIARDDSIMERWILERIFELAGFPIKRKLLWTKSIDS